MGVCTGFIFAALLEFTLVNYLWRKRPTLEEFQAAINCEQREHQGPHDDNTCNHIKVNTLVQQSRKVSDRLRPCRAEIWPRRDSWAVTRATATAWRTANDSTRKICGFYKRQNLATKIRISAWTLKGQKARALLGAAHQFY